MIIVDSLPVGLPWVPECRLDCQEAYPHNAMFLSWKWILTLPVDPSRRWGRATDQSYLEVTVSKHWITSNLGKEVLGVLDTTYTASSADCKILEPVPFWGFCLSPFNIRATVLFELILFFLYHPMCTSFIYTTVDHHLQSLPKFQV